MDLSLTRLSLSNSSITIMSIPHKVSYNNSASESTAALPISLVTSDKLTKAPLYLYVASSIRTEIAALSNAIATAVLPKPWLPCKNTQVPFSIKSSILL